MEATTPGAVYTGLAIATNSLGQLPLRRQRRAGDRIDVFDGTFTPHSFGPNSFVDPRSRSGLVPFNMQAHQRRSVRDLRPGRACPPDLRKPGQGAVAAFTTSGQFLSS